MKLICKQEFKNDLEELVRAFLGAKNDAYGDIYLDYFFDNNALEAKATLNTVQKNLNVQIVSLDKLEIKRQIKRHLKVLLYDVLSHALSVELPYGSLTGIRPTKLAYELLKKCRDTHANECSEQFLKQQVRESLINQYRLASQKADLILKILEVQKPYYAKNCNQNDVYINIPFCPSKCAYCSFIAVDMAYNKKLIEPYLEKLLIEMHSISKSLDNKCNALYIGGGTPTALDLKQLEAVLKAASKLEKREFTVEAGRPDTITADKLRLLKDYGVSRISVNPQTFNQKTLDIIGRRHREADIYTAYELACGFGFDINMDIIAMLPNESVEEFFYSIDKCIALNPQNITIHTLSLKKGSRLKLEEYAISDNERAKAMTEGAFKLLLANGYEPYYMYRQKYMSGNLENIGYTKPGNACLYNIDIMEETHSISAAGSGAISKRVSGDLIERTANSKDIKSYISI